MLRFVSGVAEVVIVRRCWGNLTKGALVICSRLSDEGSNGTMMLRNDW